MGRVHFHCLTSTPDTSTIYGLTGGYSSITAKERNVRDVMVIIKSQRNPTTVSDIQWTAVAQFSPSINLNDIFTNQGPNLACAVSGVGTFTMLFYANVTGTLDGGTLFEGIRYTPPAGAPTSGNDGQWTTIDVDPNYKRTTAAPRYEGHKLFYVQDGAKELLYHATYDSSRAIHLGIMQEAGGRPWLTPSISLKNDVLQVKNNVSSLAYGNGNMTIPMEDYDFSIATTAFLPIGIPNLSFAPYALLTTEKDIQSMYLLQLEHGDPLGGYIDRPYGVWVPGVYGEGPDQEYYDDRSPYIPEGTSGGSQLSVSEMVLIILGITVMVVGVAAVPYYVRRRRRLRQQRLEQEKEDGAETLVELNKTELDQEAAIDFGVASRPTTSVLMPNVAAASAPPLEVLDKTALGLEALDKRAPPPYTGFTTHPRPTIVTTLSNC
ncbi:hypothetical protein BGZ95_001738 [Linnemannia exigua]|uniref:Uncharacterized protein n=1 Tax=Linnemannia exigua TaxID=604196 RepID=A0AAD4D6G4_9FUNG|nr:hypothetical protein BGZ95_001738 [Linnemannia exigua]